MNQLNRILVSFALICMISVQAFGMHLHVAEAGAGHEVDLHQTHLDIVDPHSHGHDHGAEVDVEISQPSSLASAIKWLETDFYPFEYAVASVAEIAIQRVAWISSGNMLPGLHEQHGLRPPLRAPPQSV